MLTLNTDGQKRALRQSAATEVMETDTEPHRPAHATLATLAASLTNSAAAIAVHAATANESPTKADASTILLAKSAVELAAAAAASLNSSSRKRAASPACSDQPNPAKRHCPGSILSPYELYDQACKPAQNVFSIAELTEEILTYDFTMKQLFQLKRVNHFFKNTIESSKKLGKAMFLLKQCEVDDADAGKVLALNPLITDNEFRRLILHIGRPDPATLRDTPVYMQVIIIGAHHGGAVDHKGPPMFVGWRKEIGDAPKPAFVDFGELEVHTRGQSWRDTRISNLSFTVDLDLQSYRHYGREEVRQIVLPADSTMFDLVHRVYQYHEALKLEHGGQVE